MVAEHLFDRVYDARLENGLRILIEEDPQSRSVSIGAWITSGSRDDPLERPGLAHLIEHLAFKGTAERDGAELSQAIDSVGGHLNAATGRESTVYYADVPAEGLSTAADVLSDLVCRPVFAADKVELEQTVVLDEIRGHNDDPEAVAFDRFVASVWEDGHGLARPVLGTAEAVRTVSREAIVEHHRRSYRSADMLVVACGALSAETWIPRLAEMFSSQEADEAQTKDRVVPGFRSGRNRFGSHGGQSHVYLGLPGLAADDPDRYALEVLNVILGDGTSSRLFRGIREDRGLAYSVGSTAVRYTDTGLWMIYAGTAPAHEDEVRSLLEAEIERLHKDGAVAEDEFALAKARLRGLFILGLESNANRAMRLGTAAISGRPILSPDEILRRFDAVSLDDIARAIQRFASPDRLHVTVVGPNGQAT